MQQPGQSKETGKQMTGGQDGDKEESESGTQRDSLRSLVKSDQGEIEMSMLRNIPIE